MSKAGLMSNQGRDSGYIPQYVSWVPYYQNEYAAYAPYAAAAAAASYMPISMIPAPGAPYNVSYAGHLEPTHTNIQPAFGTNVLPP